MLEIPSGEWILLILDERKAQYRAATQHRWTRLKELGTAIMPTMYRGIHFLHRAAKFSHIASPM